MIKMLIPLLFFFYTISAQIALPTFQAVHKPHTAVAVAESDSQTFSYTGAQQTFTVPSGVSTITIKVWGAQGGGEPATGYWGNGGKGGYSTGTASVSAGQTIYISVGQQGFQSHSTIAFNGGGGGTNTHGAVNYYGYTGGGATHIAKVSGVLSTLSGQVSNILLVAAGGGGAGGSDRSTWGTSYIADGGAGGGTSGIDGSDGGSDYRPGGDGGTQSAGGSSQNASVEATFGLGASSKSSTGNYIQGGGGGGGYYGGGAGGQAGGGGGGGSSYIGGVSSSETIAGNATMPDPDGGTMTGRAGNGLVIISW